MKRKKHNFFATFTGVFFKHVIKAITPAMYSETLEELYAKNHSIDLR